LGCDSLYINNIRYQNIDIAVNASPIINRLFDGLLDCISIKPCVIINAIPPPSIVERKPPLPNFIFTPETSIYDTPKKESLILFKSLWVSLTLKKNRFFSVFDTPVGDAHTFYFLGARKYPLSFTIVPSNLVPLSHPSCSISLSGTTIVYLYFVFPLY